MGYCGIKWFTPLYSSKKIYTSHNSSTPTSTPHHYSSISSSAPILDSLSLYLHNFFVLFGLEIVYYTFFWEQKKCGKVVKNMFSKALLGTHIRAILIVKYSAKEIQKERYLCTTNLFIKVYFYNYFIWSWSHFYLQTPMMCINFNIEIIYQKKVQYWNQGHEL